MTRLLLKALTKSLRTNQTPWEAKLWYHLRGNRFAGHKFKRQVPVDMYIVDFCCQRKKLVVELDGGHHSTIEEKDLEKQSYLEAKGYKVLRFWNNELANSLEGVLNTILEAVKMGDLSPNLSPSPGERSHTS